MTPYTHYVIAAIPAPDSPAAHAGLSEDSSPAGERFWAYDQPTHIDGDGNEWVVIRTWCSQERFGQIEALAKNFPEAEYALIKERVNAPEEEDEVIKEPGRGGFVVVHRGEEPEVLGELERMEQDDDIF